MSILIDNSITIYEALEHIKNGKYIMPAFQRQYVWSMEQIEKLWDSILLDYPIATFLFWHVDDDNVSWDTYFCNFLSEVTFDSRKLGDVIMKKEELQGFFDEMNIKDNCIDIIDNAIGTLMLDPVAAKNLASIIGKMLILIKDAI